MTRNLNSNNSSNSSGSTVRATIERERLLGIEEDSEIIRDHPNFKLVKQRLDNDYQIPIGYNAVTVDLEVPDNVTLTVPDSSTLVSL